MSQYSTADWQIKDAGGGNITAYNPITLEKFSGTIAQFNAKVKLVPPGGPQPVMSEVNPLTSGIEFSGASGRIPNSAFTASIGSPLILACSYVPFSLTGAGSTSETLMGQVIIPDDVMGPNSKLVIEPLWQWTNNANSKTFSVKIGNAGLGVAATLYTRTRTVNLSEAVIISLANRGVKNSQYLPLVADYAFNNSQQIFTSSYDFAQPGWSLYFSGSLTNTTDTLAFLGVTVTVINPIN